MCMVSERGVTKKTLLDRRRDVLQGVECFTKKAWRKHRVGYGTQRNYD